MKRIKIGLNGFGRIGRAFTRIALERNTFDIALVNTRKTEPEMLAYLLQYDSVYRTFGKKVACESGTLVIEDARIKTSKEPQPEKIPWTENQVDVVIDATGVFKTTEELQKHIKGSVKKIVLTAPAKDNMPHIVLGVNDSGFSFADCSVFSNCSCTTNCAAPMFKVLDDNFKVLLGFLTTTHAYTKSQSLVDDGAKTFDKSRAAALNIIPSTTGAAKAIIKIMPHLAGKVDAMALRVPVATGSFSDISVVVEKSTTADEVNSVFKQASDSTMRGILGYEERVLVSSDYVGNPNSCIFDPNYTKVIGKHLVKVFGWYDNEWGYSTRLVELIEKLSNFV